MLFNKIGFPKKGWIYSGCYDCKEYGEDYAVCESCGNTKVRYVHVLYHKDWPNEIHVGCECAVNLQKEYSSKIYFEEEKLKNMMQRKNNFLKDEKWEIKKSNRGNEYLFRKYKGYSFRIWIQNDSTFTCSKLGIATRNNDSWCGYYQERFNKLEEAKRFLYEEYLKVGG